jgi:tetraacyldisaccharide 4'-kinase
MRSNIVTAIQTLKDDFLSKICNLPAMQALRRLLLPFSFIYGLVVYIRNFLYDSGRMKSVQFPLPVIGIGNLTTGGSGKTPHVEFLIGLLRKNFKVATLSRGYGRTTTGYLLAQGRVNTKLIGDEPMQYHTKFSDIIVCVDEDRAEAINNLLKIEQSPNVILMDDSYQHRRVKPGMNILLMEYDRIFKEDFLLPAGNLREPRSSMKRADLIIITKSPTILVPIERKNILEKLKLQAHQNVFFSFIRYGEFNRIFGETKALLGAEYYMEKRFTILLVTGIANPSGIIEYLRRHTDKLEMLIFPDHHEFNEKDIKTIQQTFDNIVNPSKIIVTTEKDAMRLRNPDINPAIQNLPFFFIPIEVKIHQEEETFKKLITDYVTTNQPHSRIHTRKNQAEA